MAALAESKGWAVALAISIRRLPVRLAHPRALAVRRPATVGRAPLWPAMRRTPGRAACSPGGSWRGDRRLRGGRPSTDDGGRVPGDRPGPKGLQAREEGVVVGRGR